jgi:long-chain acyl-CoA synthetase
MEAGFMRTATNYLDKPWLKSYKLGPYKLDHTLRPYPNVPVHTALDKTAEKFPNQTALLYLERSIKYHQLKTLSDKFAAALAGLGVKKGERVCVFLPNCPEFIISDWGISKAGAVIVPTSVLRTDEGLLHEAGSSNSKVIVCQENNLERVLGIKQHCEIEHIIVTSEAGFDVQPVETALPENVHAFGELLEKSAASPPAVVIDAQNDLCELAFTGGATGVPKGVMITHANRFSCILQGFPWLLKPMLPGFVGKASILIPIPLFHAYGHYAHQAGAYLGLRVILLPDPRDTDLFVEYIVNQRPFLIPAVPTQFMRIADANLGRLNALLMSGSAPLPGKVAEEVKKKTGMPISEGYGLTETSPLTHFNVSAFSKITGFMTQEKTGIGIPAPDTECKLVDPLTEQEVPFGEPGEILVRGPQVMQGYWPQAGAGLTPDGWLKTGDIGVMDEDGYFQLVDRTKDMVNVSGLKVYTTEVDNVLHRHPGVFMAAAIGVPDPQNPGSERVAAVVQLKEDYRGQVSPEDIREFCMQHLSPYAVPKYVQLREEMPFTVTEKLYKKKLREEFIASLQEND